MKPSRRISTGVLHHSRTLAPETLGDAQVTHHVAKGEIRNVMSDVKRYYAKHPEMKRHIDGGPARK